MNNLIYIILDGAVPPTVVAKYPGNGAGSIPTNTVVTVQFSEPMNAATITTSSFYLAPSVTGTVSYNAASRTATFDPTTDLLPNPQVYTVNLTAAIKDTDGMALTLQSWSFQTAAGADSTAPTVSSTSPADAATACCSRPTSRPPSTSPWIPPPSMHRPSPSTRVPPPSREP